MTIMDDSEYSKWHCPVCHAEEYWCEYDQDADAFYCGYCGWNKPARITRRMPKDILEEDDNAHEDHID